jgi:hypothetical protein
MEQITPKTRLMTLVRKHETLNQELIDAPEPSLLNLFSKTKRNKQIELIENQQKIRNISNSYKKVLMTRIKNDEKVVNEMKDSPNALRKATADWNATMNFVQSEMELFEKYLDLVPNSQVFQPRPSTTLPMEDVVSLDRMSEHRQQVKSSNLKSERSIAQRIKDTRNIAEIKKSKQLSRNFKYRLNNFEYIVITKGFFKGQYASIQNYNSVNQILNVKTDMNNKVIPLDSSEYLFVKDIDSKSDDNYIMPKFVNHNSPLSGFKPYQEKTIDSQLGSMNLEDEPYYSPPSPSYEPFERFDEEPETKEDEDEDDDLDNKSDFGFEEEDTTEPEMQTTFEQDVMAARNISNEGSTSQKIQYAKIISEILQILKLNEDNVNPYDLADTAISTYSKYNVKDTVKSSSLLLNVFLASIVYTHLNGTSLMPYEVYTKCRLVDWTTPDYLSCVLEENKFIDLKSKGCSTVLDCIKKMLSIIKFKSAPLSDFTPKKSLKQEQILYPVSQKREPFKQEERDISLRRGGPGKTRFIDLEAVAGKSPKRSRYDFENISEKRIKTLKVPPPRTLESRLSKLTIDSPECSDCGLDRYQRDDTRQQKWKTIVCAKNCPTHSISKPSSSSSSSSSAFRSRVDFSKMTLTELKKTAKSKNVINFSKKSKKDLVEILSQLS